MWSTGGLLVKDECCDEVVEGKSRGEATEL